MKTIKQAVLFGSFVGVVLLCVMAAFVIVGSMSADDILTEQNLYCAMVFEDTYPDYKNIFEKDCKEWLTEHDKSVN